MQPISVLIPTYGRPDYLERALRSVVDQTVLPAEVVVSDNHPTCSAEAVVESFRDRLPIRRISPPQSLFMDPHWLWAFRQPTLEWIALLEDDNLWRRNHLEVLQEGLKEYPDAPLFGTVAEVFQDGVASTAHKEVIAPPWVVDSLKLSPVRVSPRAALATALTCNLFASSAVMFRRSLCEQLLPHTSEVINARDRTFWAVLASLGGAVYLPKPTVLYCTHATQAVRGIKKSTYRATSADSLREVLDRIKTLGYSLPECFREMMALCPRSYATQAGVLTLQSRDRLLIKEVLPAIPGGRTALHLTLSLFTRRLGELLIRTGGL